MVDSSKQIAVIGLGNTLRRDDGIGIHLLSLLQESHPGPEISFMNYGIASLGLINYLNEFQKVLLVDGVDAGWEPGTLHIFRLGDVSSRLKEKKIQSRELPLGDLSKICEAFGFKTDVQIAGVQIKDSSYGLEMTQELEAVKGQLANEIENFLAEWHKS